MTRKRILIVEDEVIISMTLREAVQGMGYEVVDLVTSGEDAIVAAGTLKPDLILMDIRLNGEMDGIEAAKEIHMRHDIPIIFLTAHSDQETLARAVHTNSYGYLIKPFRERELYTTFELALQRHAAERTERALKKSQSDLKESEERYFSLINIIPEGIAIHCNGECIYMNPAGLRIFGASSLEELAKKPLIDYVHPDCREVWNKEIIGAKEEPAPARFVEQKLVGLDERAIDAEIGAISIPYDGQSSGLLVIRDVTERKRMDERLRRTEEKYGALMENTLDAVLVIDFDGTTLFTNPAAARLFGYDTVEEIIGRNMIDFVAPESFEKIVNDQLKVAKGTGTLSTYKIRGGDGREIMVEGHGTKISFDERPATILSLRDVTDRVLAEEALKKSEERFRRMADNVRDGLTIYEGDQAVYVNDRACEIFGYPRQELMTVDHMDLATPHEIERLNQIMEEAEATKMYPTELEFWIVRKDKEWRCIHNSYSTARMNNAMMGRYVVTTDITDLKRTEDALRQANKKLHLMSSMSRHDLINSLSVLTGYLDLSMDSTDDPKMIEYLKKQEAAADTIRERIEFTREYQNLWVNDPAWQPVQEKITRVLAHIHLDPVGIRVEVGNLSIYADPMFETVIYNLVDNALRHGGTVNEITIGAEESEEGCILYFQDNGVGIPPDEKEKIFQMGYGSNSGLGLYFIQEILSITDIAIRETGTPGKGARFEMLIPEGGYRYRR
jgi:PAS domain S-box-containing protein